MKIGILVALWTYEDARIGEGEDLLAVPVDCIHSLEAAAMRVSDESGLRWEKKVPADTRHYTSEEEETGTHSLAAAAGTAVGTGETARGTEDILAVCVLSVAAPLRGTT